MPWPKGKPRVGYVRKDGEAHARKGEGQKRIQVIRRDDPKYTQTRQKDVDPDRIEKVAKPIQGATGRPIVEVCPNCSYAYADGGYCRECGWTTWEGYKVRR